MRLRTSIIGLRSAFFNWGWLGVAVLPVTEDLGRAVFTIVSTIYLLWATMSLANRETQVERPILWLWALTAVVYLASVVAGVDLMDGLHRWGVYMLYASFCLIVLACLRRSEPSLPRLTNAFGAFGLVSVAVLLVLYTIRVRQPGFTPEYSMHEDNLPFLTPFMITLINQRQPPGRRLWFVLPLLAIVVSYVILSNGRSALFGLAVGLFVYSLVVTRVRLAKAMGLVVIILIAAVAVRGEHFFRNAEVGNSWRGKLALFSSQRSTIWASAFEHPPANPWLGVGMGNAPAKEQALTVTDDTGHTVVAVKHFHNFLIDAWYNTGVVGLGTLLVWLGYCLTQGFNNWAHAPVAERRLIGTLLSAGMAILANALLSYSYSSKQFVIYGFIFLTTAVSMRARAALHDLAK